MKISQRTKQMLALAIAFGATLSMAYYYRREGQLGHGGEWLITASALGFACVIAFSVLQRLAPWARITIFQAATDGEEAKNTHDSQAGSTPTLRRVIFVIILLWSLSLVAELYQVLFHETGLDPMRLAVRMGLSVPAAPLWLLLGRLLGKKSLLSRKGHD